MSEKVIKAGVVGVGRGSILWRYCQKAKNAQLVAVCDKWEDGLKKVEKELGDPNVTYYTDYEEFLKHDMDVVLLANYANEHAPFAVAAMKAGKNVISEVLPVQTMAEAIELVECVESTGKKYYYAENYCYMNGPYEMKRLYQNGEIGEFEYGEGEYIHNCEYGWAELTTGDPDHWRNNMSAFFYCTHSAGPLIHITGMRPVKVVGLEGYFNFRAAREGAKRGCVGIEMVTLENGGIFKSVHGGGLSKDSVWYSVNGSRGKVETSRYIAKEGGTGVLYTDLDESEAYGSGLGVTRYYPRSEIAKQSGGMGHGGSDYVNLYNIFEDLKGNPADIIDVYEGLDMWMVGFFAYLSVLNGGITMDIPDLRKKEARDQYRNDRRCTDPKVAGDQLLPSYSKGNPIIDDAIYKKIRDRWEEIHGGKREANTFDEV